MAHDDSFVVQFHGDDADGETQLPASAATKDKPNAEATPNLAPARKPSISQARHSVEVSAAWIAQIVQSVHGSLITPLPIVVALLPLAPSLGAIYFCVFHRIWGDVSSGWMRPIEFCCCAAAPRSSTWCHLLLRLPSHLGWL